MVYYNHCNNISVVADAIYESTLGHAGIVTTTLKTIDDYFVRRIGTSAPTDADIIEYLLTKDYYDAISRTRAVPMHKFSEEEKGVLRDIILRGYAGPSNADTVTALLKSGTHFYQLRISELSLYRACCRLTIF